MMSIFQGTKENKLKSLTEGEYYVAKYLQDLKIKFETQRVIKGLTNDSKNLRRIDFYLSEYDVYLEYNGQWDVNEYHRKRYREKRKVLNENNVAFIEIYPNQLGILEYSFPRKMKRLLAEKKSGVMLNKFKWQLLKANKNYFDVQYWLAFLYCTALAYIWPVLIFLPVLVLAIKSIQLRKIWNSLHEDFKVEDTPLNWPNILAEANEVLTDAAIPVHKMNLIDYLKGRNESLFTELIESEYFGFFSEYSDDEILSKIKEQIADKGHSNHTPSLTRLDSISDHIDSQPLTKIAIEDYVAAIRKNHPRSHEPWSKEEDRLLKEAIKIVDTPRELSSIFKRTSGALRSRLDLLSKQ